MQIIVHRVNTVEALKKVPVEYGVEIDVRGFGRRIVLNHEPLQDGEDLEDYLKEYNHAFAIFNIKEAGIEDAVISLAEKYGVEDYFLLDVEFPYLYRASRGGVRKIAIRYSEDECIETVLKYKGMVDWVWVDTNTMLPLDADIAKKLDGFKLCLVCPERWGRPQDIEPYRRQLNEAGIELDAVMTALDHASDWSD